MEAVHNRELAHHRTLAEVVAHTPQGAVVRTLDHMPLGVVDRTPLGALDHTLQGALEHTPLGAVAERTGVADRTEVAERMPLEAVHTVPEAAVNNTLPGAVHKLADSHPVVAEAPFAETQR